MEPEGMSTQCHHASGSSSEWYTVYVLAVTTSESPQTSVGDSYACVWQNSIVQFSVKHLMQ